MQKALWFVILFLYAKDNYDSILKLRKKKRKKEISKMKAYYETVLILYAQNKFNIEKEVMYSNIVNNRFLFSKQFNCVY